MEEFFEASIWSGSTAMEEIFFRNYHTEWTRSIFCLYDVRLRKLLALAAVEGLVCMSCVFRGIIKRLISAVARERDGHETVEIRGQKV